MKNRIFETHIHLSSFKDDLTLKKHILAETSFFYLNVATTLEESKTVVRQAKIFPNVFASVGIHPLYIESLDKQKYILGELEQVIKKNEKKVVAVGECGLDFYKTSSEEDWKLQEHWFKEHIELSIRHKLPLVLHLRNAYSEALKILKNYPSSRGIIHSFDGELEELKQFLALEGEWFISFSPLVFRNLPKFKELICSTELKKILVESDSPYLSQNQSICRAILRLIANLKSVNLEKVKKIVFQNSLKVFQLNNKSCDFKI